MAELTSFLYGQQAVDPHLAASLALLDLNNLLAALEWRGRAAAARAISPEPVIQQANRVESLVQNLGRPRALQRAVAVAALAAAALGTSGWSHAQYLAVASAIDRLLDARRAAQALPMARQLLETALAAGEGAYELAAYDLATCHTYLGCLLHKAASLRPPWDLSLRPARFQRLADVGNANAARMATVCLKEHADALQDLGRLDEAAAAYEEAIELATQRGNHRAVALPAANSAPCGCGKVAMQRLWRRTTMPARPSSVSASQRKSP